VTISDIARALAYLRGKLVAATKLQDISASYLLQKLRVNYGMEY